MLSKCLIQFSVDGWGCVPSLFFDLRPNYGGGNEDSVGFFLKVPCMHCYTQCPQPCSRPLPTLHLSWRLLDTHRQVWVSLLWDHCSFLLGPGAQNVFLVPSMSLIPQSCVSSVIKSHWPPKSNSLGGSQSLCQIPRLGNLLWILEVS